MMKQRNITTYTLIKKHKILSKTIYNPKHNKHITTSMLERLCDILDCTPNEVIGFIKTNKRIFQYSVGNIPFSLLSIINQNTFSYTAKGKDAIK